RTVEKDVRSAGTNLVHVKAGNYPRGGEEPNIASGLGAATTLVVADADAIGREVAGVKHAAPAVRLRGWIGGEGKRFYGQILGTDASFPLIYVWSFARGRFFDERQVASRANVAVLGSTVRDRLFGDADPIGRSITIRDRTFAVVGVTSTADEEQV